MVSHEAQTGILRAAGAGFETVEAGSTFEAASGRQAALAAHARQWVGYLKNR